MSRSSGFLRGAMRGVGLLFLPVAMTVLSFGQNLNLSGSITNNGTLSVGGNINNNAAGPVTIRGTGYVQLQGTGGGSHAIQGNDSISFAYLRMQGSRNTTLSKGAVVHHDFKIGHTTTYTGTLDIGTQILKIGNTSSSNGASTLTFSNGTVVFFDSDDGQAVFSRSGGVTYGNLTTSGGTKTVADALIVSSGKTFTNTSATVDFGANAFTGTGVTFANSGVLASQGSVTLGTGTTVDGTFRYNLTGGSQTVADATYSGTLDLTGTSTKSVGNVVIGDVYTVAGSGARTYTGTVDYAKLGAQSVAADPYNSLTLSGSGLKTLAGTTSVAGALDASTAAVNVNIASGTTTLGASATANFGGNVDVDGTFDAATNAGTAVTFSGGAQTITGDATSISFRDLTLSGTLAKTSALDLNVAGTFTPTRGLAMGNKTLDITNSVASAVGAFGSLEEVTGAMKRAVTTTGTYTFNNSATSMAFTTEAPTTTTLTVSPVTPPTGYALATHVNRQVTFAYTGTWDNGTANLKLGYADAEKPSANENKLRYFEGSASAANKVATGATISRTLAGASFGQLDLSGIRPSTASSGIAASKVATGAEVVMSNIAVPFQTVVASQTFATANTWDEGAAPGSTDDVRVSHTGITVAASATVAAVTIDNGAALSLTGGDLSASSIDNQGTLSSTGSNQLTVSGTFTNNNSTTNTFAGPVTIGSLTNTSGTLAFDGGSSSISGAVSNAASGVINVGGTLSMLTGGLGTLTSAGNISVTGTGTFNVGQSATPGPLVASSLSMTGTSTLSVATNAYLNVFGDLDLGSNVTLSNDGTITVGE